MARLYYEVTLKFVGPVDSVTDKKKLTNEEAQQLVADSFDGETIDVSPSEVKITGASER